MAETIFHRIVAGEIPCHRVYEDEKVLAFLDINPLSEGHTLVIPKIHAETLDRLPEDYAAAIGAALPRIARAIMKVTGVKAYNVLQNNGAGAHQAVMWVHFHIIPKYPDGAGLGIVWQPRPLSGGEELARDIAAAIEEENPK